MGIFTAGMGRSTEKRGYVLCLPEGMKELTFAVSLTVVIQTGCYQPREVPSLIVDLKFTELQWDISVTSLCYKVPTLPRQIYCLTFELYCKLSENWQFGALHLFSTSD